MNLYLCLISGTNINVLEIMSYVGMDSSSSANVVE